MEVSYEHAGEIWFGCLKVVQFEILREVMVGFYWSICEIGGGRRRCRGRGGGGNCRFCRASPQHLRDVISPQKLPKSISTIRVIVVYSLHKILKKLNVFLINGTR